MPGDPYWSNVVLLMGFEGANGATSGPGITDESTHAHGAATVNGTAHIDTSQFEFGASSLNVGFASAFLTFPDSNDWQLSTANSDQFTVETWVRFTAISDPNQHLIVGQAGSDVAWYLAENGGTSEFLFVFASTVGGATTTITSSGAGLTAGVWYNLAVDKDATGKIRLYRNGVMVASSTPANSIISNSTMLLNIGCYPGGNGTNGWIDELRVTKGAARYASDSGFTVPTAAYPRGPLFINAQLTQIGAEEWADGNPRARATQIGVEYWAVGGTPTIGYLTQMAIEQWAPTGVCVTDVTVSSGFGTSAITPADVYTFHQ